MSQRLFSVGKVGAYLDSYSPGVEKRRGEDVSTITLHLRIQPFDAKLASALDAGVGEDSNIRATVFSLSSGDPKPAFTRHDFKLGLARQNLVIFASPDTTESRMGLLQAKISGTYVRTQQDMNALAFAFKVAFGPVGRDELEFVHAWHRCQKFITFEEAEPLLGMEDDGDEDSTDADEKAREVVNGRPTPMWNDPAEDEEAGAAEPAGAPMAAANDGTAAREKKDPANRALHVHRGGKKPGRGKRR